MNKVSSSLSNKMANISFVCACLIVVIHACGAGVKGSFGWYVSEMVEKGVARCAIPWFLFASGFWLAGKFQEDGWYVKVLVSRVRSLVVPYFCWCVIWGMFSLSLMACVNVAHGREWMTNFPVGVGWLRIVGLSSGPWYVPMWYIQALMAMTLLSPILALDRFGVLTVVSGVLWLADVDSPHVFCFSWMRLFFFAAGACIRCHIDVIEKCRGVCFTVLGWVGVIGVLVLAWCRVEASLTVGLLNPGAYADLYLRGIAIIGIPALLAIVPARKFEGARTFSFPLYVMHCFPLALLNPVLKRVIGDGGGVNHKF